MSAAPTDIAAPGPVSSRQIIKLAAPISLAMLIPQVSYFTNSVFLGRLGVRELGVNGITGVFYLLLSMIGYGLSSGMQIQMARRAGEGDKDGLARTLANGAMLALLCALGLMFVTLLLSPLLFGYSLHDAGNLPLSTGFIYIRVWGLPFLLLTQMLSAFYVAAGHTRVLIYGSLAATIANILFDYALIFGHWGFPAMGFNGAAMASVIAEAAYFVTMAGLFFFYRMQRAYPVYRHLAFDAGLSVRSLRVAAPLIVQFLFSIGGWYIFFIFIEHIGVQALAASQVLRNIFGIAGVGTWALATTCNTMVSNIIGQGRQQEVAGVIRKICVLSLLYAAVISIALLAGPRQFLSVYSSDAALIAYAIPSLRVIAVAILVMSLSTVVFNGVAGTGNTLVNLAMEITCVCSYLVYCFVVIWLWRSPLYICWGAEFVYWTTLLAGATLYLKSGRWKGKVI